MIGLPTLAFELPELGPMGEMGIPLLGVLLITIGMMMGIRKKRRRSSTNISARDHVDELRQKQAVRGDLEQLMIEVEQLAKRFGTQLDAKTMQMERLIDEANAKIEELKQLEAVRQNQAQEAPPPSIPLSDRPPLVPVDHGAPALSEQAPLDPDDRLKQSVCELADQGHDPIEIARKLDEHVGKIELILALARRDLFSSDTSDGSA